MSDTISRQAAIDEIDEWIKAFRENGHKESAADACLIQDGIIQLPSADAVEVRRGRWVLSENQNQDDVNNGNYLYVCSNCNHSDIHARTADVPYCWHCGARMNGEQDG